MKRLLEQVDSRTESVIKKHCKEWLSCEVTALEKAFPYLPPTLMALLAVKAPNEGKAGELLDFLEENDFDGKWAQKPEELLNLWMSDSNEVVPKVDRAYEYIMSEHKSTTLEQLESTGDLEMWQLKRLLPFLSAILLSSLAEWVSEEQADGKKLLTFLKGHYEEIKRATPSKLMEILKQQPDFWEKEKEKPEKEEVVEEKEVPLPSFRRVLPFIVGIFVLAIAIFWLNTPDLSSAADLIPWNKKAEEQSQTQTPNPRIWHLDESTTLQLEGDDPFNKLVERVSGISPDSNRQFYLEKISWKDTVLPTYYLNTIEHLKTLHSAYPNKKFHINISLIQQKKDETKTPIEERLDHYLKNNMAGLLNDNATTYSINLSRSNDWNPDLSDELVLHAEMEWSITIRK